MRISLLAALLLSTGGAALAASSAQPNGRYPVPQQPFPEGQREELGIETNLQMNTDPARPKQAPEPPQPVRPPQTLRYVSGCVLKATRTTLFIQTRNGAVVPIESDGLVMNEKVVPGEDIRASYSVNGKSNVAYSVWTVRPVHRAPPY
jgi:hypothetical protein